MQEIKDQINDQDKDILQSDFLVGGMEDDAVEAFQKEQEDWEE